MISEIHWSWNHWSWLNVNYIRLYCFLQLAIEPNSWTKCDHTIARRLKLLCPEKVWHDLAIPQHHCKQRDMHCPVELKCNQFCRLRVAFWANKDYKAKWLLRSTDTSQALIPRYAICGWVSSNFVSLINQAPQRELFIFSSGGRRIWTKIPAGYEKLCPLIRPTSSPRSYRDSNPMHK